MRLGAAVRRSRPSHRALAAGAALLVAAGLLAGCSNGPEPVKVGAVYPLTGSQGLGGLDEFRGVQLAADVVNDAGGVDGHPIDLLSVNTPTSDAAPGAVDQLRNQGVRFVLGSNGSTISAPAAATAAQNDMLYWETGAVGEMTGAGRGEPGVPDVAVGRGARANRRSASSPAKRFRNSGATRATCATRS